MATEVTMLIYDLIVTEKDDKKDKTPITGLFFYTHTHTHPNFSTKKKTAKQPITKVNPVTKKGHHWLLWGFHFGTDTGGCWY